MSGGITDPVPFDAGDRGQVVDRAKTARRVQGEQDAITKGLMSTTHGRAWVYARLADAQVFASCFSDNALHMARMEGERNAGLKLLADVMRAASEDYVTMITEHKG